MTDLLVHLTVLQRISSRTKRDTAELNTAAGRPICSRVARPPWKMFGDGFACSPCRFAAFCKEDTEKHTRLSEDAFLAKTVKQRVKKVTICQLFFGSQSCSHHEKTQLPFPSERKHRDLEYGAVDDSESDGHELFRPKMG